jgi:hypothetical protein
MAQEFFIKSSNLESKVRELLPSQGGLGAGFDLSASTQIIPIVDLTESAEGSNLGQDLQSSLSFDSVTAFSVANSTTTIISNTGYFRVFGAYSSNNNNAGSHSGLFQLNDGASAKIIWQVLNPNVANEGTVSESFDFMVFLQAGESLEVSSSTSESFLIGCTRQIASIDGTLVNP